MSKPITYKSKQLNADILTPIGIFQRLQGDKKFLLESSLPHEKKGKYSFIGTDPYEEIIGINGKTTITCLQTNETKHIDEEALTYLNHYLPEIDTELPLPFAGGAIGYVGYDAARQFVQVGKELDNDLGMPDVHLMLYKSVFVYDHKNETVYVTAMNPHGESEAVLDERIETFAAMLEQQPVKQSELESSTFKPDTSKEAFKKQVQKARDHIQAGDAFQIVVSQRMQATFSGDPFSYYRKLRRANPSPYMFYIEFGPYLVLGASPESLIQISGREMITNPIAGTRPRGETPAADEKLVKELLADEKELAEHKMLIDLGRNDFNRVAKPGSMKIPSYMQIEKYEHVMHIVSEVSCILQDDKSSIDALIASLPAGTVSGAPKVRAMQLINELEQKRRGAYGGGIGYIGFNRNLNMALAIRSLIVKDQTAYLQVGAGIVFDSDSQMEYEETLHKARSLMEVNDLDLIN